MPVIEAHKRLINQANRDPVYRVFISLSQCQSKPQLTSKDCLIAMKLHDIPTFIAFKDVNYECARNCYLTLLLNSFKSKIDHLI